jgi:uncharacterized repeat protein (TIGR01451 family)
VYKCWATPPCTYALSRTSENFSASGGSDSVGVTANPGTNNSTCPWSATSNASWITITSGSGGSGNGQVSFTVAANTGAARQGTMTIAGQTFTVSEDAVGSSNPSADLSITKTGSPNPVTVGSNLTYTITVTNNGPSGATGVTVSDSLPSGVTFVSATPSQGNCSGTTTISCGLGSLSNGGSATVTIVVTPTQAGGISNTATVTRNETDPDLTNNSDTRVTTVNPPSAAAPTISSFTPASGGVGTSVTIQGTNLAGATSVKFNGTGATFHVKGMHITATVPAGATTGPIAVTTPGGTATSAASFTVIPPPTIAGFSPTSGPTGTMVTITGTGFTGTTNVMFNNTNAKQFTVVTDTQITAAVPNGAKTGSIGVTTPGGMATSGSSFTVTR